MYIYIKVELQGYKNVFNVQTWGLNCEQCMNYMDMFLNHSKNWPF